MVVPPGPCECEAVSMQDEVPVRKRFPRKVISVAIVIIVLAGALFSYSLLSARDAPVKIGVILPMTGPYAYMAEVKDNLEMAVNEINEWSGLNDRPIELIVADCQSDSDVAADLFHEMEAEHHPFAYIAVTSGVYIALAPLAEEAHVVLLGLAVAVPDVTEGYDWCFRYYTTTEIETDCIAGMLKDLGAASVGLLYVADVGGMAFAQNMNDIADSCGCSVLSEPLVYSDDDYTLEVSNLSSCDAIVTFGPRSYQTEMLTELDECGYGGYVMAGSGASAPVIRELPAADGVYVAAPLVYKESNVLGSKYVSEFEITHGYSPSHIGITGYDGMMMIWGLMVDVELTRDGLRDRLQSGFVFNGVLGSTRVEAGIHDINFPLFPALIIDGGELWFL